MKTARGEQEDGRSLAALAKPKWPHPRPLQPGARPTGGFGRSAQRPLRPTCSNSTTKKAEDVFRSDFNARLNASFILLERKPQRSDDRRELDLKTSKVPSNILLWHGAFTPKDPFTAIVGFPMRLENRERPSERPTANPPESCLGLGWVLETAYVTKIRRMGCPRLARWPKNQGDQAAIDPRKETTGRSRERRESTTCPYLYTEKQSQATACIGMYRAGINPNF